MLYVRYAKKFPKLYKLANSSDLWSCGNDTRKDGKFKQEFRHKGERLPSLT